MLFGRILAAYGGVFVAGSLGWAVAFDNFRPDRYDLASMLGYRADDDVPHVTHARQQHIATVAQVSLHLLDPQQMVLCDMTRDWRPVPNAPRAVLTDAAQELLTRFDERAVMQRWSYHTRIANREALRLVLGWLGVAAPLTELDVVGLRDALPRMSRRRVTQFLTGCGMLLSSPKRLRTNGPRNLPWPRSRSRSPRNCGPGSGCNAARDAAAVSP